MKKFLYIHVNKCGGTSVKSALKKIRHLEIPENNKILENIERGEYNNLIKFTIVRHPIKRFESLVKMIWRDKDSSLSVSDIAKIALDENINYKIWDNLDSYIKRHSLPISHPHYGVIYNDSIYMNHIFKLESIDADWVKICDMLNIKIQLPKKNSTEKVDKEVILDDCVYEKLLNYYAKDFLYFNYKIK